MNRTLIAATFWALTSMGMMIDRAAADPPNSSANSNASSSPYATGSGNASAAASTPRRTHDRRGADTHSSAPRGPTPLDLRLGDLRHYFTPAELESPLPDMIGDEIVVEGSHGTAPDPSQTPIPVGLVAPFWALTHPFSAWRVFVPDPNASSSEP